MPTQITLTDRSGKDVQMNVGMSLYKRAADEAMDVRLAARYEAASQNIAWDPSKGDLLDQMFVASGLMDGKMGGKALTMKDISRMELSGEFRRPDGSDTSLGARVLFPQLILETLKAGALDDDGSDIISTWNGMVAMTRNVNGQRAEQPIIDVRGPEESRSGRIAQMAEPETMISITTGQKSFKIPTYSIGLLISDEAQEATTVDLVRIVMESQARGERVARIREQLNTMINGDTDMGIAALTPIAAKTLDSSAGNGTMTRKAYLKWLYSHQNKANLTKVLADLDSIMALDSALLTATLLPDPSVIKAPFSNIKLTLPNPEFTPIENVVPVKTYVAFDPRYAIQRFVNVSASYEAVENYVMRKATGFRVDYGEMASRLHDEAWSVLEYATNP
jgi:hypothetical protein